MPLAVEAVTLEPLQRAERQTTVVHVQGLGAEGFGEDVTYDMADRISFRRSDLAPLCGSTTLRESLERISRLDLSMSTSHPVVAAYRRWAIESALVDLALVQAGVGLAEVLALAPRPVRFVVSPSGDGREAAAILRSRHALLPLKLDPRSTWTRPDIDRLASLGGVEILDLKGTYPGTAVYQPADARLYRDLLEAFPEAWLEDPALTAATADVLRPAAARISWDEPVHGYADLDRLRPVAAVNVKPSRLGSLASLLALVERCRERGIALYGGGQSELGPGRGQIQLLAALFYPDGPNDVAPVGYDDPAAEIERSPEPLVVDHRAGFRSGSWPR